MRREFIIYLIICLIVGILVTGFGFSLGIHDFMINFIAGWGQFFVEIFLGFFIIEKFMERQHNKQWEKVRKIYYRILSEHLIKILTSFTAKFNFVEISKDLIYRKKTTKGITVPIENLVRELNYIDSQDPSSFKQLFIEFYEEIEEELKKFVLGLSLR